ncbi:transcription regulator HTH, apses-type DNA-binding domain-containing protein, partial [Mycotypha africana]|uniref:transcription regulator HTH, apses-type DNA-binding domain-containing protein n=1 Tax=Mycotypha africana TaxID=64632 RepID=UPI002300B604
MNAIANDNVTNGSIGAPATTGTIQRPKLTTTVWEDEGTLCYQVDAKSVCVARRQDNDMINGTKLLNVVGMSRGKRDGILKNEKGRVVVKVGAMHLKGVWITFNRAKDLATKFKIVDILYPLFVEDPSVFLTVQQQQQ